MMKIILYCHILFIMIYTIDIIYIILNNDIILRHFGSSLKLLLWLDCFNLIPSWANDWDI